jgi:superfamily II DNA or RNA helicase
MKLRIDDRLIAIVFENKEEEAAVKGRFTFSDNSLAFLGGTFNAKRIRDICFVKTAKASPGFSFLPSGFLQDLLICARERNIKLTELKDERTKLDYRKKEWTDEELHSFYPPEFKYIEHQLQALKAMLRTNIGIIEAPTSSGKTEIIIAFLKATQLPALIVVNRITLAMQICERLNQNGLTTGLCHGKGYLEAPIMVSTIQSVKKMKSMDQRRILILDEVHRAQATTYQDLLKTIPYPVRFGFSATPNCGDRYKYAKIRQFMGNIICKIDIDKLIENKVVAKPTIKFIHNNVPPTPNWPLAYQYAIVENKERNDRIKKTIEEFNTQSLVLIRIIEHGEELKKLLPNSVFVSGIDDPDTRTQVIRDYEEGKIQTLISSSIFNEGISIKAIRLLIIASGGKSKIETIQRLGRSLRVKDDKVEVDVFDFDDAGNVYTERHSKARKSIYSKAGFEIEA